MATSGPSKMVLKLESDIESFMQSVNDLRIEQFKTHYPLFLTAPKRLEPSLRTSIKWLATQMENFIGQAEECEQYCALSENIKRRIAEFKGYLEEKTKPETESPHEPFMIFAFSFNPTAEYTHQPEKHSIFQHSQFDDVSQQPKVHSPVFLPASNAGLNNREKKAETTAFIAPQKPSSAPPPRKEHPTTREYPTVGYLPSHAKHPESAKLSRQESEHNTIGEELGVFYFEPHR